MDVDKVVGVASDLGKGLGNSLNREYRSISAIVGSRYIGGWHVCDELWEVQRDRYVLHDWG